MEGEVRTHLLAGLFVHYDVAFLVAKPEFGIVVVSLPKPFRLEYVLEYGFAENALHLVLALECAGQGLGLVAYGLGLLLEVLDRFGELSPDGSTLFGLRLFLRLERFLHLLDIPVKPSCDSLHGFGRFLLESFLPSLEGLFVFKGQGGFGRLDGLFLSRLELCNGLFVTCPYLLQGLVVLGFLAGPQRFGGMNLCLFADEVRFPGRQSRRYL